ncbi:MAG: TolC family protein [Betaproteobacteria bacterium]|nr:TolC family protein [Betaproteobacteria bacterium]
MSGRPLRCCLLALVLHTSAAFADGSVYDFAALRQMAVDANLSLAAARDGVDAARAGIVSASAYPNPETELTTGGASPRIGGASGHAHALAISQRIDNPWVRSARIGAAEALAGGAEAGLRQTRVTLLARLQVAFYELLRRQEELSAARDDLALAESIYERVKVRVDVGEAPRYDLIRAEAERLTARNATRSAELRVNQSKVAIRGLVAERLPADFQVRGDWSEPRVLPPLEQLRERVLGSNPELAVLRAEQSRFDRQVELEKARRMPEVAIRAVQERDPDLENNRVGVLLTIPIWDRRAGPIAENTAQGLRVRNQLEYSQFALSQSLESAYGQYDISRNQITILEGAILREAEAAVKVAEAAYRFGERGILEVLDARRVFRAARNELIAARYDLEVARIEIDRLQAVEAQ